MLPEFKKQCIGTKVQTGFFYTAALSVLSPVAITLAGLTRSPQSGENILNMIHFFHEIRKSV